MEIPPEVLEEYLKDFITEMYKSGIIRVKIWPETQQEIATTDFAAIYHYIWKEVCLNPI